MEEKVIVLENKRLAGDVFEMKLLGGASPLKRAGQFINIKLDGFFLRRPISVCSWNKDSVTIIYKVVGEGTRFMSRLEKGAELNILSGLGNGFDLEKCKDSPLLVGGGVGIPPLYGLACELMGMGKKPQVIMGFNSGDEVFYKSQFQRLGIEPVIMTADGSLGKKGLVTDGMRGLSYDYVFACGPEPMLKAVSELSPDGQFSFEARMACGFGACMGCSCETKYGYKRICKDGPVLFKEEIIW